MELLVNNPTAVGGEIEYKILNADGSVASVSTQPWHNDVLDRFWTVHNAATRVTRVTCKVGSSNTANVSTMTALAAPITLSSGSYPFLSYTDTTYTTLKRLPWLNANEASSVYIFTFAVGQIVGSVRELGFDWSASTSTGASICTRVVGFPDIVLAADQQLVVTYRFRFVVSSNTTTANVNASLYGVSTPIQLQISRRFSNAASLYEPPGYSSPRLFSFKFNGAQTPTDSSTYVAISTGTLQATPAGYQQAVKYSAGLTEGNFAGGIQGFATSSGETSIYFTPAIVKDGDSTFSLSIRNRLVPLSGASATTLLTAVDTSQPVVSLIADIAQNKFYDEYNRVTAEDPKKYIVANFHGLPAVLLPHWEARLIRFLAQSALYTNSTMSSMEVIFFYSPTNQGSVCNLFANASLENGDSQTLVSGQNGGTVDIQAGTITTNNVFDSNGSRTLYNSNYGQWLRLVVHRVGSAMYSWVNGVQVLNLTAGAAGGGEITAYDRRFSLLGTPSTSGTNEPQALLIHRLRHYSDYLVPSSEALPTLLPRNSVRTMWLETFSSSLPTTSGDFRAFVEGGVTRLPTGGPGGIPAAQFSNGRIHLASPNIQFLPTDEFTLEFDVQLSATPSVSFVPVFAFASDVSAATVGVVINNSNQLMIVSTGSSTTGTTTLTIGTWANIVIVRRTEGANMVTYIFKDGVLGFKMTNTGTAGASRLLASGYLGVCGNRTNTTYFSGSLANIRLTRGVIEYFNASGFTPPAGLKTAL